MNEEKKINTSSLELEQETAYVKSNQKKNKIRRETASRSQAAPI